MAVWTTSRVFTAPALVVVSGRFISTWGLFSIFWMRNRDRDCFHWSGVVLSPLEKTSSCNRLIGSYFWFKKLSAVKIENWSCRLPNRTRARLSRGGGQKIVKTVKAQSSVNDNKYRPTARVAQEKILKFLVRYISSSHGRVVWSLSKYTFVTEWFPMATGLDIWLYLTVCNWSPNNCFQFLDLNLQDYRGQASTGTSCMCSVKTHDVRFLLRRSYLCLCTDLHMANRY